MTTRETEKSREDLWIIKEMAKVICDCKDGICRYDGKSCDLACTIFEDARALYTAGYRKASEVAEEIFAEIEEITKYFETPNGCAVVSLKTLAGIRKKFTEKKSMIVETIRDANHGDWKTRLAHKIPPIPKGTRLAVIEIWNNFYGKWVRVEYNGRFYDISPADISFMESEEEE